MNMLMNMLIIMLMNMLMINVNDHVNDYYVFANFYLILCFILCCGPHIITSLGGGGAGSDPPRVNFCQINKK